jgi:hypothetical protein
MVQTPNHDDKHDIYLLAFFSRHSTSTPNMAHSEDPEKLPINVQESEQNVTPLPAPMQGPRHSWEKLGLYNLVVLGVGTAAIFLGLAMLLFLWGSSTYALHRGGLPHLWYWIVDHEWATKVVTLSTVLIRLATAAHLGVFAALLAALILERVGVATESLPLVS